MSENIFEIAIIGMSVRAPGVNNLDDFWSKLISGDDFLSRSLWNENGRPVVTIENEIPHWDWFDEDFFAFTPVEALFSDPQQRVALEMAWEAFEDAGMNIRNCPRDTGIYFSTSFSHYHSELLKSEAVKEDSTLINLANIGCFSQHAATRMAYKLDLRGPAMGINSACSSSLVAIAQAIDGIKLGRCQVALAGAVSLRQKSTYQVTDGSIHSPDGYCRPFDISANGTVPGQGGRYFYLSR